MQEKIGQVIMGIVTDENVASYFVQKDGVTYQLNKSETIHEPGDMVEGFVYKNQKQQLCLTEKLPKGINNNYAFCEVVSSRRDLGVFVDVGLPDKEVAVSMDELPDMRELWPKIGDELLISLYVDDQERLWGRVADEVVVNSLHVNAPEKMQNKDLNGVVYRVKLVGTFVLTEERYIGFIHPSERFQEPRLGEKVSVRVIGERPDGILNLSLKPRSYEVISDDAAMILTFLEKSPDGTIPFSDKSSPEDIKKTFAISKAQFKRALGSLMKERKIIQENGETKLVKK